MTDTLHPDIDEKLELIHLMDSLGIHMADIGLPGSSQRAFEDCLRMCQGRYQSAVHRICGDPRQRDPVRRHH